MKARSLIAALAALAALQPAVAQQNPNGPPDQPARPALELSNQPFRLESVGLSLNLPLGAVAQTSRMGSQVTVSILPAPPDDSWAITIQTPQSRNTSLTAAEASRELAAKLLEAAGIPTQRMDEAGGLKTLRVEQRGAIVEFFPSLSISGITLPAARFYVRLPGAGQANIVGYTVFSLGAGKFVSFEIACAEPGFAKVRSVYETIIATARFEDPDAVASARGEAVQAGMALLDALTPEDYHAVLDNKDRWFRLYIPGPGGSDDAATELGYRRIRSWAGSRGDVDASRSRAGWGPADRVPGYLIRLDARLLHDDAVIDSSGTYFMSKDRSEEMWTLQNAVKRPGAKSAAISSETGVRSAASMTISTSGSQASRAIMPQVPERGYISQFEGFVLPRLLIRSARPVECGFYSYQPAFENVRFRRDSLRRPPESPTGWIFESRPDQDSPPTLSRYDEKGNLIRADTPDGAVWESIELDRLVNLWKRKGLPMN